MSSHESERARELTDALQHAALMLINHLHTNSVRLRVEGTTPAIYITLSEGRNTYGADAADLQAEQAATVSVAAEKSAASYFARLRKALID